MRKKLASEKLECLKKMPPLHHTVPGESFDIARSQVTAWLTAQPGILLYLWDHVRRSGYVKYDAATGTWQGIDYGT